MHHDPRVKLSEHRVLFKSYFQLDLYRLSYKRFDGTWSAVVDREVFERGQAAALIPYDPVRDEIVLIEQFRPGALAAGRQPWLYEIVAGIIDDDESAQQVAHRESAEETGMNVLFSEFICDYLVSPGGASEVCHLFAGCVDARSASKFAGISDEAEDIKVHVMSAAKAFGLLHDNRINNAVSIIALQWLEHRHQLIRDDWQHRLKTQR